MAIVNNYSWLIDVSVRWPHGEFALCYTLCLDGGLCVGQQTIEGSWNIL
jgi:hypothetical protein